jgi:hypothetical protein
MDRLPNWVVLSMIPAAAVLTPVLGFSIAVVAAIMLGLLKEAGLPTVLALAAAGFSGFLLGCKPPVHWRNSASVEMKLKRESSLTVPRAVSTNVTPFPAPRSRLAGQTRRRIKAR